MSGSGLGPATRTKLVCTLGPATNTPAFVRGLAAAGTSIFRVNFSHGTPEDHARAVRLVREAERDRALAVLADLPGPKVRLGTLDPDPFRLTQGNGFDLRPGGPGDERGASTTHPGLADDLRVGDRVLLADGAVELVVSGIEGDIVRTECVRGGTIRSGQGVNVPAEGLSLPAVTDRDREGLARALDLGVDLVAQSFVRAPGDVIELRSLMGDRVVPVVAKIETRPAIEQIDGILDVTDALMVARGDLGVELPMEEIPLLQKDLLRRAQEMSRPVIVATQMLESMIRAPRPTRAEASDVANAVLDGADAIMLSGETAIGDYPFEAAAAGSRIAAAVDARTADHRVAQPPCRHTGEAAAVAHAVASVATSEPEVVAIACYTETGRTARLLSTERPSCPIYAFIPDERVRRVSTLNWGVVPVAAERPADTDEMIALMDDGLRRRGLVAPGALVVMAASSPAGRTTTNMLKLHQAGSPVR
ncbi:MAG TPA: pyruvate kinase [Actinomycetota bacterium]|jgi:pyruvate kinase|nr:pyruvate kinase [Actinomycetota bacterium]